MSCPSSGRDVSRLARAVRAGGVVSVQRGDYMFIVQSDDPQCSRRAANAISSSRQLGAFLADVIGAQRRSIFSAQANLNAVIQSASRHFNIKRITAESDSGAIHVCIETERGSVSVVLVGNTVSMEMRFGNCIVAAQGVRRR